MASSSEKSGHEPIPTYEESLQQGAGAGSYSDSKEDVSSHASPLSLTQILSNARSQRITAIMKAYIDPLLQTQAQAGLFKTTLVLVPTNSTPLQHPIDSFEDSSDIIEGSGDSISNDTKEAVIGFPSEDYVKLVRLHGNDFTLQFWSQPKVVEELDSCLKARLQASGHRIADTPAPPVPPPMPTSPRNEPAWAKRGFFGRKTSETPSPASPKPNPLAEGTWRYVPEEAVLPGHVRTKVGLEDVCLRVVTEMGLYETKTGKAVVVRIEIGT